jgi:serine/threonine protein kinase
MSLWVIAVHPSGQKPHSTEWVRSRFDIGMEVADDVFTVQGEGILPRHVRVVLGPQNATLESLSEAAQTTVQGAPLEGTVITGYPLRIRIGGVEMLVDKASASSGASGLLDVASGFVAKVLSEPSQESRFTTHNETPGAQECFQRTMGFALETQAAPFGNSVTIEKIYALKREIARGGMGRVFLAEDKTLNRQVALKVGHTADAAQKEAFYREARILSHISHPNIVPVHNLGEDAAGRPFYSMKLVRGQTLQSVIRNLRKKDPLTTLEFSTQRLLSVFRRVCNAIEFAHSAGYLHRDIKPENVMIGEYGEVLVMDWGLAQALGQIVSPNSDGTLKHARKYVVEGTPQYMSPEQAFGDELDERTDIYSLGSLLYAILTLQAPVQGASLDEILRKVKDGAVSAMYAPFSSPKAFWLHATKRKGIPTALQAVVRKAMHLDSSKRYKRVTDLIRDIEAYQGGFATSAESAGVLRQIGLMIRRHRPLVAVLAFALVGAAISAARLAVSERNARAQTLLVKKSAGRAAQSVLSAQALERAAVEVHEAARVVLTNAMLAATRVSGNDRGKPFNIAPFTLEATDYTAFKSVISPAEKNEESIVLLSHDSVQLVNWGDGAFTTRGNLRAGDVLEWPLSTPLSAVSRDAVSRAMLSPFETPSEAINGPLEIMVGSPGELSLRLPLKPSLPLKRNEKFLLKHESPLDAADQQHLIGSSDEHAVLLLALRNQCLKWTFNAAGITCSTFMDGSEVEEQALRLYLGEQIVELDPMTRAFFFRTIRSPEN